jgi:DNA (cytosine-5)-methyltransferase 1
VANQQSNDGCLRELALFAGAGGGILGGHLLGWRTVCAVEWEPYPACVLAARQNDGILPPFPIWDEVQTFDGKPWRGIVDVVSGGFPCQDISSAGKGAGITGERSGLWKEFARIIGEVRPRFVFVENSPMLTIRGLGVVLGDLSSMGFDAKWGVISAADCGAPHERQRIWIVANAKGERYRSRGEARDIPCSDGRQDGQMRSVACSASEQPKNVADTAQLQRNGINDHAGISMESGQVPKSGNDSWPSHLANTTSKRQQRQGQSWFGCDPAEKRQGETDHAFAKRVGHIWGIESPVGRVADGVAARVDRLKAIGNGQVPVCAATAFKLLSGR